jgi:hypothetical protein
MSLNPNQAPARACSPAVYALVVSASSKALTDCMALPFDMARERYACAVRAGLLERSLLASARFGKTLTAMERLTLGPWARRQ